MSIPEFSEFQRINHVRYACRMRILNSSFLQIGEHFQTKQHHTCHKNTIPKQQTQTKTSKMTVKQLIKEPSATPLESKPTLTPCTSDSSSESSLENENSSVSSIGAVPTEVLLTAVHEETQLAKFPRLHLAHLPTPLEYCPRLSAALGGVDIYVKRDDCTGLGTGGNKARKLGEQSYHTSHNLDDIF